MLGRVAVGFLSAYSCNIQATNEKTNTEMSASAQVQGKEITGTFHFFQAKYTSNTEITGEIRGLYPEKKHGLSIHDGSLEKPEKTFNPFGRKHGGPWNFERKVGDLGNIEADKEGVGRYKISEPYVKLSGPFSVLSKVITVHENPDDFAFGKTTESLETGAVGEILAKGVITN
ncbi:hypothetical protein SteCoe_6977 [Stentor coeruleus]|uniref:Superoxide dismutase copper/zinc binding domain-containing protein n=1 Tax=Stentor coeruleus TaxID=5963 RepID=A0A1R2CNN2_9CILI|nr:hypothetical protein SteCoe_6977 [Stentor coeruleus]